MKYTRYFTATFILICMWIALPSVGLACERCFGAGSDSPIVSAIGVSMLGLLVMVGFVFGGILSFFNQANNRAKAIAAEDESAAASTD